MTISGSNFSVEVPAPNITFPEIPAPLTYSDNLLANASTSVTLLGKRSNWVDTTFLQDISDHLDNTTRISSNPIDTENLAIVSTSPEDALGNTGTHTVNIVYLDSNGLELNQNVDVNGTTPVALPFNAIAIQRMKAVAGGSFGTGVGEITLYSLDNGNVYESLSVNGNRSLSARYMVPANKEAIITSWGTSVFNQSIDFRLRVTADEDTKIVSDRYHFRGISLTAFNTSIEKTCKVHCPPLTQIKVSGSLTITSGSPVASCFINLNLFDI